MFMQIGLWGSSYNMQHPVDQLPFTALENGIAGLIRTGVGTDFNDILEKGMYAGFDLAAFG